MVETFVIQMSTQHDAAAAQSVDGLRGVVEHVGSGRREAFADSDELVAFLRADHPHERKEVER